MEPDLLNRPLTGNSRQFPAHLVDEDAFRVMTYNIRIDHAEDRDGPHDWRHRCQMVTSLILGYGVTLAAIQEANIKQLQDLKAGLPGYAIEGFSASLGEPEQENLLICYQVDKLVLLESAIFSLSPTPGIPGIGWDAKYPRSCMYCKFVDRRTIKPLVCFNTHFDHKGQVSREESAKLLMRLQHTLAKENACIVMGDLNPYPDSNGYEVYSTFTHKTGLSDIRNLVQDEIYGPDGTWMGWEYDPTHSLDGQAGARLDHIFLGGPLRAIRTGVLNVTVDSSGSIVAPTLSLRNYPSDHLPVVADLKG